jgi:hypothetical protein
MTTFEDAYRITVPRADQTISFLYLKLVPSLSLLEGFAGSK